MKIKEIHNFQITDPEHRAILITAWISYNDCICDPVTKRKGLIETVDLRPHNPGWFNLQKLYDLVNMGFLDNGSEQKTWVLTDEGIEWCSKRLRKITTYV